MASTSIVQPGCTRRARFKDQFKREVEKELTGRETEPWEIIYFKLYQSQIPVVEQAIETAALMLGTDKSRGYCLEMICADFLAGASLDNEDPILTAAVDVTFLQIPSRRTAAGFSTRSDRESFVNRIRPKRPRQRLDPDLYDRLRRQVLQRDGWRCQWCGAKSNLEVHHKELRSQGGEDSDSNLITLCVVCHAVAHRA
jgi:HNH endonuclease